MQYEIYLDVFFLVNFSMDYLILLAVKRALKCTATHGYVLLGAFAGAFSVSVLMCIPMYPAVKILIMHLLVNSCMLIVSLRPACVLEFIREWILLYIVSFLMGGIMTWVRPYMGEFFREGVLCFSITVCSYYLLCRVMDFLEMMWKFQGSRCKVTLYFRERVCTFRAVIDSGNSLCDTLSCKPVHIIDKKAMKELTEQEKIQYIRYIPYCTIQENESVLPVFTIDKMCIHGKREKIIEYPLFGISAQERFNDGNYDVILHPEDC
ncbi:MAG: sigma-E processing peptidase SpoIIGA [Bariatricus sp.]